MSVCLSSTEQNRKNLQWRGGGGGWVRKLCQKDNSELKTVIMNHNYFMVNDLDEVVKSVDLEETPAFWV